MKKKKEEEKSDNKETTMVMEELVVFSEDDLLCICVMHYDLDLLVDSGATHYATMRRNVFVTYYNEDFDTVKMKNKDVSQIAGIGDIHLETETVSR